MNAIIFLMATATVGVDYGWRPAEDGKSLEYLIRISPELLNEHAAEGYSSEVDPLVQNVRRFRIYVGGEGALPHDFGLAKPTYDPQSTEPTRANPPPQFGDPLQPRGNLRTNPPIPSDKTTDATDKPRINTFALPGAEKDPQHVVGYSDEKNPKSATTTKASAEAERPWWPLMASLVALFGSVGGNLYLGMVYTTLRSRYRTLVQQMKATPK